MKLRKARKRHGFLALACALAGGGAALGCDGDSTLSTPGEEVIDVVDDTPRGTLYFAGGEKVTDAFNNVALDLPDGWYAVVPRLGVGSTTIASYDMRYIENELPDHSSHSLLDTMAKLDIAALDMQGDDTVAGWVEKRRHDMGAGEIGPAGAAEPRVAVSDMIQVRAAEREGYAYVVHLGMTSAVEIVLPWKSDQALVATLMPAATTQLDEVLTILDQIRTTDEYVPGQAPRTALKSSDELVAPIRALIAESAAVAPKSCSGWTGSDSGSIAPNTPFTLYLPFYWQTWWQAGGAGSFWGNGYHGNCYDDYYAIDFNRTSSSTCTTYVDDTGQNVYPVASGTAYVYRSSTGYGNRVDVVHSSGIMSRYAHLQNINVSSGQAVSTQTVIGWVGNTGNSAGPHLHFGFYQNGVSRCNSSSGWCPNGERAKSPQTPKPSPMYTNSGSRTIQDYGCYQAPP